MEFLALRPYLYSRREKASGGRPPRAYQVVGLPEDVEVVIGRFGNRWQILIQTARDMGQWRGDYASAEDALAAVQAQLPG